MNTPLAVYLHIPFCAVRCPYCDFNTYAGLDALFEPYAAALAQEIRGAGAARGRPPVRTVFIGGGTPTVLPADLLAATLAACGEAFDIAPGAEITSEANPGTVDQERFDAMRTLGINRLSMGVQSFDEAELRWLGRIHGADEAEAAFRAARRAGFTNINLDFIFGLPGQRAETWARTLQRAIALGPEHLSLYSLMVEQGTPLADQVRRGLVAPPDDDLAAELYELACEYLNESGYVQYEISNWTMDDRRWTMEPPPSMVYRPSSPCHHNLVYWRREPYLGFGAGAHSFEPARAPGETDVRWWNVRPVREYIERITAGRSPRADREQVDRRTAMGEAMLLGLRLVHEGMPDARFREQFGVEIEAVFAAELRGLVGRGLLERLPDRVRLTPRGRLLGNQVFAEFLP